MWDIVWIPNYYIHLYKLTGRIIKKHDIRVSITLVHAINKITIKQYGGAYHVAMFDCCDVIKLSRSTCCRLASSTPGECCDNSKSTQLHLVNFNSNSISNLSIPISIPFFPRLFLPNFFTMSRYSEYLLGIHTPSLYSK